MGIIEGSQMKVYLVDIVTKDTTQEILEDRMRELESLVATYWWLVVLKTFQKKDQPDYQTYIGKWKLEEIIIDMQAIWANILIVGNILKSGQIYNLNEKLRPIKCEARDRVDLILKIFGKHAEGMEARYQIELAAIKHMWPRIYGMWMELSRQWWGSKLARWVWETNTEIMKRHLKDKEYKIKEKLKEYEQMRQLHRDARTKKDFLTVWIVGYTNTGKSSLLNLLTKKNVLAENKLFATLWTNVWKMFVFTDKEKWIWKEILLNDTIWFIRDLPPNLIHAFRSTLEDSIESKILFHVIDSSDPFVQVRIDIVNEILDNIWAEQKRIMVFNKIDLIDEKKLLELKEKYSEFNPLWISVHAWIGLEELKDKIIEELGLR